MPFEFKDFDRSFTKKGDQRGVFNVVRFDDTTNATNYYAFMNEDGSYVIMRMTLAGTEYTCTYYAVGKKPAQFATDWAGRSGLSYVEFYQLFPA
jgi:hypothetical protein